MLIKMLGLAILTEALVQLIFTAAPLQGARAWLIKKTPALRAGNGEHLLECKYCTSVWIAAAVVLANRFDKDLYLMTAAVCIIVARISNYVHVLVSWIRDAQINKRLERK